MAFKRIKKMYELRMNELNKVYSEKLCFIIIDSLRKKHFLITLELNVTLLYPLFVLI